jgi:hypothetical protein
MMGEYRRFFEEANMDQYGTTHRGSVCIRTVIMGVNGGDDTFGSFRTWVDGDANWDMLGDDTFCSFRTWVEGDANWDMLSTTSLMLGRFDASLNQHR